MKIVGVGGKIGSGKSTVSRLLALRFSGRVVSLASALKGCVLQLYGTLAFFPQQDINSRLFLQHFGELAREEVNSRLWCETLKATILYLHQEGVEFFVIPDVRYPNEIEFLKDEFGKDNCVFIYLEGSHIEGIPPSVLQHSSEQISPDYFDLVVTQGNLRNVYFRCEDFVAGRFDLQPQDVKPLIYIGGSINFNRNYVSDFAQVEERLRQEGFRVINPATTVSERDWTELVSSHTLDDACVKLVNTDLSDVAKADAGLFFLDKPSIGASMEIFAMRLQGKPIVIAVPLSLFYHPWLRVFGKVVWNESLPRLSEHTIEVLKGFFPFLS